MNQSTTVRSILAAIESLRHLRNKAFEAKDTGAHLAVAEGEKFFPEVNVESVRALLGKDAEEKSVTDALRVAFTAAKWTKINDRSFGQVIFATSCLLCKLRPMVEKAREEERAANEQARRHDELERWVRNLLNTEDSLRKELRRPMRDLLELDKLDVPALEALHASLLKGEPGLRKEVENARRLEGLVGIRPAVRRPHAR